ncbi:MAG: hypothetical protein ALECFALPRED_004981 [Alectoria fallacina]|uniref:Trichothecene 3-O-acetyltransferase-like N-terminal domain-containing protein n=1 Tax=Alectoria fallacina TaxID=1903189 RepID=A0A8H3FYG2_9LECA|nr:MAG: hypothetical protein ALECFALPRED_004981 [Alectoria fallacina]
MEDFPANEHHLSTLEQISPQAYVRFILCFRVRCGASHDQVTQILRQGLELTTAKITLLNGLVVSVTDSNGRETKDLRQNTISLLTVKDLRNSNLNFEEIRSQGFPSKVFDGGLLCPTAIFAVPESPVPVFLVQANLITGGLLLGLSVWHGALDGTAITTILRVWAYHCRAIQDPDIKSLDPFTLSASAFDRSRLSKVSGAKGGRLEDHPEFLLLPEVPTALPPGLTRTLRTQIFHFSPDSISALKEVTSPSNSSSPQTVYSWISTNTAISALVWRSIMAATYAHENPIADSVSIFSSPLNARKRMDPPLAPDLLASVWGFQDSRLPINSLLEASLADVALVIRKGTDQVDASYLDSLISMIDSVPNPSLLLPLVFTDVLKTCSILTSWAGFSMYDFDWGEALGGKCERVRTVSSGMFNGMQVILPQLPEGMGCGGLEVVIGLEDDAMERLKGDKEWMKYARLL